MLSGGFIFTNVFIDILFFIDIVVCFRTTYIDDAGVEINDPRLIAKRYIKGDFFVDFFATIPID